MSVNRTWILGFAATLFVAMPSAFGGLLVYDNGTPSLATAPVYPISTYFGKSEGVSDTFYLSSVTNLQYVDVALWYTTGASLTSLTYCITAGTGGVDCTGTPLDSSSNAALTPVGSALGTSGGYTLQEFQISLNTSISYTSGLYWLTLSNANPSTGTVFWDTTGGVGCTTPAANGCPSGAYSTWAENYIATQGSSVSNNSQALDLYQTPEPASFLLAGGGLLLAGFLRCKRH